MKMSRPISFILTLKLVAMATSSKRSGKRIKSVIYDQICTVHENMLKIGTKDPEIICLKSLF